MAFFKRTRLAWIFLAILLLALLCILNAVRIVNSIDHRNNDFFTFYLAGHLLLHGGDPYSPAQWVAGHEQFGVTWIPNQAFVYPLPLSLLFIPLALLPLYLSYIVWVALSQGMILISLYILFKLEDNPPAWRLLLPLLVGLIFFRPATLALVNGQLTAFLLFLLAGALLLWSKGKWAVGASLLSLLMLKPNIGAPLLLVLVIWFVVEKRGKALFALFLGGLFLLGVGMILDPSWVPQYLGIGGGKLADTFGYSPTVWGLASMVCDFRSPCTLLSGGVAAFLLGFVSIYLLASRRVSAPLAVLSLAVALTLLVTPYTWTYDQLLLLLPMTALIFSLARRKGGFLPAALLFPGMDLLVVFLLFFNTALDIEILNAFIPLLVFILLAFFPFHQKSPLLIHNN